MTAEEPVPEPYLPLWLVTILIVVTCLFTALYVFALAHPRTPRVWPAPPDSSCSSRSR